MKTTEAMQGNERKSKKYHYNEKEITINLSSELKMYANALSVS